MRKILLFFIAFFTCFQLAQAQSNTKDLLATVQSFCKTSAVTGREDEAAQFVQALFDQGVLKKDHLGDLVMTIGSGAPKRLFTAPLDEPGYVISAINKDGYLRIAPAGFGAYGNLYHQFLEGNDIQINTDKGPVLGVAIIPSMHFEGLRAVPERSKTADIWQDNFIDVGESSAKGVNAKGIRLLDPLTTLKKPQIIDGKFIAATDAATKSAVIALAAVAKTLMNTKFNGSVTIAFTTLELINGKGLEDVVNKYGPFDEVYRFNRFLDTELSAQPKLLVNQKLPESSIEQEISKPVLSFRNPSTNQPNWGNAKVYEIGLPANYKHTPVEMTNLQDIQALIKTWLSAVELRDWAVSSLSNPSVKAPSAHYAAYAKEDKSVANLISKYGVSSAEKPVREYILSQLPKWAKPTVDAKGNIILTFGKGKQHLAFVAHMDEVGYVVDSIREDGKLVLAQRGGFFNSVWEAHAALVHTQNGDITAAFEPRGDYLTAKMKENGRDCPLVFAGFTSKKEALDAGVVPGESTVTMPKKMLRLSENRASARGFDDRVGCASLLLALQNINPEALPFKVTFVWSVEEETGLTGSTFAADGLKDVAIVYPIDTYVSTDDPIDPRIYAYCPLGGGMVIRVLESINMVSKANLKYVQNLAAKNHIQTQYGMTAGGTDGQAFLQYDIPSVPLSWPGRYSHSPVEILDFRDLSNLVKMIQALVMDHEKSY